MKHSDHVYMIYDTKQSDVCVAQFDNIKGVANYFNKTNGFIRSTICKKKSVKNRYIIERVELEVVIK